MIEIAYKPSFLRQLKKLPENLLTEVKEKIKIFTKNPKNTLLKTHELNGKLIGKFSFSVNYKYRIVFMYETKNTIILLGIGTHDIYK